MKKLLTILLVLISFSSFAQFEAGEFVNTDTVKLDGVPLLLNTFKKDSLGSAGNLFYSTGASSQPASGSVNQVIGGNSLIANYLPKWDGSKLANSLILEGTKQINVEGVINTNTEDVTVSLKNKYRNLLSYNSNALLIFQDSIYSGSSYIYNFGYGFGHATLQLNSGANSNGFGYYALQSNSGAYSNGFGHATLQLNSGANSNGFGGYALQSNSGAYSNGFGHATLQSNSGAYSNGFGGYALALNSGAYCNGFGAGSLFYNNYANAIGIGHQSTSVFLEDVTTTKNFTDTEVTANTITFTAAHGFGATGTKVNLKFKTVAGTPPTGLANNGIYQFTITSATVLTLARIGTNASLDFEGSLTKNLNITNSIAIGTDVNATKQNQIVLGGSTYTETLLFGNVGINKTPTEALDVNGNLIADVLKSRVPTGTAPLVVASTTKVDSLNAGFLDGKKASDFQLKSDTSTFDATLSDLADSSAAIRAFANTKAVVSGTDNYIPKITGANTLGNSLARSNNIGIGIGIDANRTLHIGASGQPTFAFSDTRGSSGSTTMGFLYDAGISLTKPGIVWQKLSDNAGFVQNLFTFFQNGTINFDGIAYPDSNSVVFGTKKIGLGTTTPAARIHSQSTTTQLRLGYDATKYTDLSTESTGNLTIDPTGDTVKVVGAVNSTGGFFKNGVEITGGSGSMVYPPSGIAKSTGTGWATSIVDNSSNWNNAYTYRLTGASGTSPLTLSLSANKLTGSLSSQLTSIGTLTPSTGYLYYNGSSFSYAAITASQWTNGTYGMYYNSGNVTVGSSSTNEVAKLYSYTNSAIVALYGNNGGTGHGVVGNTQSGTAIVGNSSTGWGGDFTGLGCRATKFYVSSLNTAPASSSATGTTGEIRFTSDYIYVCVATNTWKRTQISTW